MWLQAVDTERSPWGATGISGDCPAKPRGVINQKIGTERLVYPDPETRRLGVVGVKVRLGSWYGMATALFG